MSTLSFSYITEPLVGPLELSYENLPILDTDRLMPF
jgi:hypothetical protein